MRNLALAAFGLAVLALSTPAAAQDFRATVTAQLDAAAQPVKNSGFKDDPTVFARDVMVGMLANGTSSFVEINLTSGATYFIAAACDQDCEDMDLRLFSPESTTPLKQDTGDDDYPMITFTAQKTGRYMLAVDMAKCKEGMCYYGYRVFRK